MTNQVRRVLIVGAVGASLASAAAYGVRHSTAPATIAAPAALLSAPAASLAVESSLAPSRDQGLPATKAASQHARSRTSADGAVAGGNPSESKSSDASDSRRTKTIQVHSHYTEPSGSVDGAQCRGLVALKPDCQLRYVGTATFTGTMWGDEYYDLTGWVTPGGQITYEGYASITGGVEGCGTGSYIIDGYEGSTDMTRYDPVTHGAPGYVKWRLRPGSGTGQLTNLVSGEGEVHWTDYFVEHNGDTNKAGEGDVTGTITCRL